MVYHVAFYKLKAEVTPEKIDEMIRSSRSQLVRVPEVLTVRSGKKIDPACEWPFFVTIEFESMDKKRACEDDPVYIKFLETVIRPNATEEWVADYELEPGRPIKYS
ncbi:MAG: Dabb family protein [Verrucomicrobiales bacterium]|nr:Dabb family protein [Verrucomicrobiae bacterium]